jgi:hypothetical protein
MPQQSSVRLFHTAECTAAVKPLVVPGAPIAGWSEAETELSLLLVIAALVLLNLLLRND